MCYRQTPSQHAQDAERTPRQQAKVDTERKERNDLQEQRQTGTERHVEQVEEAEVD
ncbi:hypothetical protein GCM10027431_08090 [Lysobacter rhizosphaerae]